MGSICIDICVKHIYIYENCDWPQGSLDQCSTRTLKKCFSASSQSLKREKAVSTACMTFSRACPGVLASVRGPGKGPSGTSTIMRN